MRNSLLSVVVAFSLTATGTSFAQSVERVAQAAINAKGKDCPNVTAVKAIGKTETGTTIVAAACSNGQRHVLKLLPNDTLEYVSTCAVFESVSRAKCF